jgi:hypothetical protein
MKTLSQGSQYPDQNLNLDPPKYKSDASPLKPAHFIVPLLNIINPSV